MRVPAIRDVKLSLPVAVAAIAVAVAAAAGVEAVVLDRADHPKPYRVSCLGCHSDKRTLAAMADKAGDPLYLVHSGEVTIEQLKRLEGKDTASATRTAK